MTKVRTGPNCASIRLAQDAFVGVKHSPAFSRLAQRRIAGALFAARDRVWAYHRSMSAPVNVCGQRTRVTRPVNRQKTRLGQHQ